MAELPKIDVLKLWRVKKIKQAKAKILAIQEHSSSSARKGGLEGRHLKNGLVDEQAQSLGKAERAFGGEVFKILESIWFPQLLRQPVVPRR